MLREERTAIIFTANTPHLAHANLMIDSLMNVNKGNFHGDLWVISTGLSDRAKNYLDSIGANYLTNPLGFIFEWKHWKKIAESQPEYSTLKAKSRKEKALVEAFQIYRNKRMSKLILLDWVEKFGELYDFIALGDNDLYFQKSIHELFTKYYKNNEKIYYWKEENEILPGTWIWKKDFHYSRLHSIDELDFGRNEINIGFIMGKPDNLYKVFQNVKEKFFELHIDLFAKYNWHDQDLVRLDRALHPESYALFSEGDVVHLCNGGNQVLEEKYPLEFYHKKTEGKPYVVHFAGGAWNKYPSVESTYKVEENTFYFSNEVKSSYDIIREGSLKNIFDEVSDSYYTEQNKNTREISRQHWLDKHTNGKPKVLFIGWLQTQTHKSTLQAIPRFFDHDLYDLAVLHGNSSCIDYNNTYEEFPIILAQLSRIAKDPKLISNYGHRMSYFPEWIYENILQSAMIEYQCTERVAIAIANLVGLYFSDAIGFYRPQLVCLWGFLSPWGKMITDICKWKDVAICSVEWGILPGTIAFDFCGHMAESWVAKQGQYFNTLPLSSEDIEIGEKYLEHATSSELSRNHPQKIDNSSLKRILEEKKTKRIILYIESNSAHSGNTLKDSCRAIVHSPIYKDDNESYQELVKLCRTHEDWHILYKPHPISVTRGLRTVIDKETTSVLWKGSLEEALHLADVSISILSQGAYVSLIHHVPTILLGRLQLNDSGAAYVLNQRSNLEQLIQTAFSEGITDKMQNAFLLHVSRALKYYVFRADESVNARDSYQLGKTLLDIIEGNQDEYYKYEREAYCRMIQNKERERSEEPLVSVIMPVYNAAEYLSESINSICNQSLRNLELICVNNGSTDNSQEILRYFADHDERIRVYQQDEPNQRSARNLGYQKAKGKYVYLIDSDDYLDYHALETVVQVAENHHADAVYFFFREVRTDLKDSRPRPRWYSYRRFFPKEKVFRMEQEYYKFFIQYPFPWAKIIRRDLVLEKKLFFDLDCENFDDNPHNLRVLLSLKNIYVCNEQFYNFRIHEKSMTQSVNPRIMGMIDAVRIMNEIYHSFNCYDLYAKWYVPYKVHLIGWAWDLLPDDKKEVYLKETKKLFSTDDELLFHDDSVWSYFEMPNHLYLKRIQKMLKGEDSGSISHDDISRRRLYFWGMGDESRRLLRNHLLFASFIEGFINSTPVSLSENDKNLFTKKVYRPDEIDWKDKTIFIVVATKDYYDEISRYLKEKGLEEEKDYMGITNAWEKWCKRALDIWALRRLVLFMESVRKYKTSYPDIEKRIRLHSDVVLRYLYSDDGKTDEAVLACCNCSK